MRLLGQRRLPTMPVLAAALAPSLVAGCTGPDMAMGFDGSGPIPPASIGTGGGTYGSPSMNASMPTPISSNGYGGIAVAVPPAPVAAGGNPSAPSSTTAPPAAYPQSQPVQPVQSSGTIASAPLQAPLPPAANEPPAQQQRVAASAAPAPGGDLAGQSPAAPAANAPATPAVAEPTRTAALSQSSEIQFLPLVGAPNDKANLLAQALADQAARSGVTIRPASDGRGAARLKGYFSTFDEGSQSVLVYVWDVLDENDERIHRIQGQERFPKAGDDAWAGVDRAILDKVAARTLEEARAFQGSLG